jgi:hypothetical protein
MDEKWHVTWSQSSWNLDNDSHKRLFIQNPDSFKVFRFPKRIADNLARKPKAFVVTASNTPRGRIDNLMTIEVISSRRISLESEVVKTSIRTSSGHVISPKGKFTLGRKYRGWNVVLKSGLNKASPSRGHELFIDMTYVAQKRIVPFWKYFKNEQNDVQTIVSPEIRVFMSRNLKILARMSPGGISCWEGSVIFWMVSIFEASWEDDVEPIIVGCFNQSLGNASC